jgi:penicillin-binding protein 2
MASVAATVANGGDVWKPRLCMNPPAARTQEHILPVDQMNVIREGMRRVVNDQLGTGQNAASPNFTVAGKTGTAQKMRQENGRTVPDNQAWFIGFAPFENPRYAICVLVENGEAGGKTAAPLAKNILEQAMAIKVGQPSPAPQRRTPVKGHFRVPGTPPK